MTCVFFMRDQPLGWPFGNSGNTMFKIRFLDTADSLVFLYSLICHCITMLNTRCPEKKYTDGVWPCLESLALMNC